MYMKKGMMYPHCKPQVQIATDVNITWSDAKHVHRTPPGVIVTNCQSKNDLKLSKLFSFTALVCYLYYIVNELLFIHIYFSLI